MMQDCAGNVEREERNGIIFLIDATEKMFKGDDQPNEGKFEMFFRKALRCCHSIMKKKMMASEKDLMAVVFFGTTVKNNRLNLNHLFVLQPLKRPDVDIIKFIDEMIKCDLRRSFASKYGHSNRYILQDALWLCQSIFSNCDQKMDMQRIILFTATDEPHAGNIIEKQRALDQANELNALNISLELLPFGPHFNTNLFYKDLMESATGDEYSDQALGYLDSNEELLLRVNNYHHRKLSHGRHLFYL